MVATQWGNILAHGQGQDRGVFTVDVDEGTSLAWENKKTAAKLEVPNDMVQQVFWRTVPSGCKLTLLLEAGVIALFTGFKRKDKAVLAKYFAARCSGKLIQENPICTDGLNFGRIAVRNNEFLLLAPPRDTGSGGAAKQAEVVSINLSRVKNCAVPINNEVEVQCDTDDLRGDDEALDMIRFFVPPDVDGIANAEEVCEDVKEVTDTTTGDVIFEFDSSVGSFMTPRGKYFIEMYREHLRLRGTTYDFNIDYANIQKIYLLPDPKSASHFLVMCLREGLQQGRQLYQYLVLKLKEEEQLVQSAWKQAELDEVFGTRYIEEEKRHEPNLLERSEDLIYRIVAKCFHFVAGVKIFKTSDFISSQNFKAVSCAVGNSDGLLYPLTKGLMYLHKPAILIPYKSIHEAIILRIDDKNLLHTFDLEVIWVNAQGNETSTTFKNIGKKENSNLIQFLRRKKVRLKKKQQEGSEMIDSSIIDEQFGQDSADDSAEDRDFTEADAEAAEAGMSSSDDDYGGLSDASASSEDYLPAKKKSRKGGKKKGKGKGKKR